MSEEQQEFFCPVGPSASATANAREGRIFNVAVTTSSAAIDLAGAGYEGLYTAINGGRLLTLTAQGDVWYRWATATGTVDETKTAASTPANQGILLPGGIRVPERAPPNDSGTPYKWLIVKAPVACILCIQVSGMNPNAYLSGGFGT